MKITRREVAMTEKQRQRLENHKTKFLSLGITKNGEGYDIIGVPWEKTCNAFNMHTPDVYISADDLRDQALMNKLLEFEILGCYISTPLDDYSFISKFKFLRDLSIAYGENVTDLDFLSELHDCRMLYIEDARLKDLETVLRLNKYSRSFLVGLDCVGLLNCQVEDVSCFERERSDFSEFLIWEYEGKNERDKWKHVRATTLRYYEIERKDNGSDK